MLFRSAGVPAERLVLTDAPWPELLERLAIPICGSIVAVELVSRMLGCRSAETARRATVAGGMLYLVVGLVPVYLGLVGPALVPGLTGDEVEQVIPKLAQALLPGVLFVLFAGAMVSAILSTVDSVLLATAGQISHNIVLRLVPGASEAFKVRSARASVVLLAIVAAVVGATAASIRDLVEVASSAGSTGIFIALLIGINSSFGGERSAAAAIVAGALAWVVGHVTEATSTPYLVSLAVALVAYVWVAITETYRPPIVPLPPTP